MVKLTKEDAYFLKLSKYQPQLEAYLKEHPELMQPESRYNEMYNNFLKPGLKDLCVSRSSVKWGIPVTFDESQTVYVWIDALSNYISALGYSSENEDLFNKPKTDLFGNRTWMVTTSEDYVTMSMHLQYNRL